MPYTKLGPFTNNSVTPPINAALLNGIETALAAVSIPAPAPSGGDDTATLQALLNTAQATGGTLILQAGTYQANLLTNQSFTQPRIVGQGMNLTILQGTVNTSAVIKLKGGSGGASGGYLADFSITAASAGGGIGLQIADACGVTWNRLHFTGTLAEGVEFYSESSGGYAEYNHGDAIFEPTVVLPVRYRVNSGTGSFHGSGLTHGSLINQSTSATGPMIQIDANAFPYAAPLSVAIFPKTTGTNIIANNSAQPAAFVGDLDIEVQVAGPVQVASTSGSKVYLQGTLNGLAASNLRLGQLYLADKVYFLQGTAYAQLKPYQRSVSLLSGDADVTAGDAGPQNGGGFLITLNIVATNYFYWAQLLGWQSPTAPTGTVTVLASSLVNNGSSAGAPTLSWNNYGLRVSNTNYSSSYIAHVGVVPMSSNVGSDVLGQF